MTEIKIDREDLLEELYRVRSLVPVDAGREAKEALDKLVAVIANIPADVKKAQYARIGVGR